MTGKRVGDRWRWGRFPSCFTFYHDVIVRMVLLHEKETYTLTPWVDPHKESVFSLSFNFRFPKCFVHRFRFLRGRRFGIMCVGRFSWCDYTVGPLSPSRETRGRTQILERKSSWKSTNGFPVETIRGPTQILVILCTSIFLLDKKLHPVVVDPVTRRYKFYNC